VINPFTQLDYSKIRDINTTLFDVEINGSELCNRTCSFCPRHDPEVYPNQNLHMSIETCSNLVDGLKGIESIGVVSFVGFGEPLLFKNLIECVKIVREGLPNIQHLEVNTNGDKLTTEWIEDLYEAGCNLIAVSMYDEDITDKLLEMKGDIPITLFPRHHYEEEEDYGLVLVNRNEIISDNKLLNVESPCYLPFYKALIDWNGDVLLCANDWSKTKVFGNVNEHKFSDIWLSDEFNKHRKHLMKTRKDLSPCDRCDIPGTMRGEKNYKIFKEYLK